MSEPLVLVTTDNGISTVVLNRPKKLNAISAGLAVAVRESLDGLRDATRVVILAGAGERGFTGGADVHEMQQLDPPGARRFITTIHEMCWAALSHPQPIIAAIHGHCIGAGLELAMSCDFRIVSEDARLSMPEIRLGIPSVVEAARMLELVGGTWTNELLFSGDVIDAHRAAQIGLVSRVVARDRLQAEAMALARQIASYSPVSVRLQKSLIRAWRDNDLARSVQLGIDAFEAAYRSGQPNEGIAAFLQKRPPRFG